MNRLPIIISVVALMAVILLFVDRFSGESKKTNSNETTVSNTDGITVAYVKFDTLLDAYRYYNEKKTEFMQEQQMKEINLDSRYKALQRKAYEIQRKVEGRMMTPTKAQKKQEELALEQQRIMQDKQMYEIEIMESKQEMMLEMLDSVKNYLKIYNTTHNFSIIFATDTIGSAIMLAQDKMDITNDIIIGLNNRYK